MTSDHRRAGLSRWIVTALVWCLAVVVVGAAAFFVVLLLAGPHAGLVPPFVETVILAFGWLTVLVLPLLAARAAWRRFPPLRG